MPMKFIVKLLLSGNICLAQHLHLITSFLIFGGDWLAGHHNSICYPHLSFLVRSLRHLLMRPCSFSAIASPEWKIRRCALRTKLLPGLHFRSRRKYTSPIHHDQKVLDNAKRLRLCLPLAFQSVLVLQHYNTVELHRVDSGAGHGNFRCFWGSHHQPSLQEDAREEQ